MLSTILKKRAQLIVAIMVISILMVATTAFAVTKLIKAKEGGVLWMARNARLVIPPRALKKDTVISADMFKEKKRIVFEFDPDGTVFARPAKLQFAWSAVQDVDDFILYGDDGEKIKPKIKWWGLEYRIKHFSLYYFRRR